MKPKQMMLFAVAIGCGLVAMIGAQTMLAGNKAPEQELVKVFVAKTDIDPGVALDDTNVEVRDVPKDLVIEGTIIKKEEFAGRALKIHAAQGMPLMTTYLGPKGQVGVTSLIPAGMQLVTIPVDASMSHSGLLRPGSYVSISCVMDRPGRDGRPNGYNCRTVLSRVKVIAVGQNLAGSEGAKDANAPKVETISLVTYPVQAKLLSMAKVASNGRMQLALLGEEGKSNEDNKDLDEGALTQKMNELFGPDRSQELEAVNTPKAIQPNDSAKRPNGSSFSDFLKEQPVPAEITDLGSGPSRAVVTHRIEIYNGDKKEVQVFELPDEPASAPAALPAINSQSQWTTPLMEFFTRKRKPKTDINETQVSPTDESRPETSNDKSAASPVNTARQ